LQRWVLLHLLWVLWLTRERLSGGDPYQGSPPLFSIARTEPIPDKSQVLERSPATWLMPPSTASRIPCFFDGACPRNQFGTKGPMRAAFVVGETRVVCEVPDLASSSGPVRSNNIAEYQGLIFLLRHLQELDGERRPRNAYRICGDSQLVIRQMRGEYRVTTPHLVPLHREASRLKSTLDVEFEWVPREKNPAGFLLEP